MDSDDINDEEFLKACEESAKFYTEIEVPARNNAANSISCITLDDSNDNLDAFAEMNPDPGIFSGQEAEGFDMSAGGEWIYPTNFPIREYQKSIVSKALFNNTLVCLPTGLGKTFIAAVVMYNYHRWYPKNKIVFMAHSKPLVAQQVQACCNIMGISKEVTAELNGNMSHQNRKVQWETKKIFFLTPQVFNNDLARGSVKPESIRCLVIDEAHKALGNQAYCQVIHSIKPFSNQFRVLALSATPGDKMNMVHDVIQNLMISHLEIRTEENPDVKPYLHQKKIEVIEIKLDEKIQEFKTKAERVTENYLRLLASRKVIPQSRSSLSSYTLLLKQKEFHQDNNVPAHERGLIISNFGISINLFKAIEELQIHGLKSFLSKLLQMQSGEGSKNTSHTRLVKDEDFKSLIQDLENYLGPDKDIAFDPNTSLVRIMDDIDSALPVQNTVYSHPKFQKLEEIITKHFNEFKDSTRVIIFCKSRPCTGEICNFLLKFRPLVKPMIFIGQSQTSGGTTGKGFNQATQLAVMKKFREGSYNTLVATCVAEEGLDIGEVDLIVNFDSTKNSNTQVQRSGRTGRKRDGRVVNLVTEGKEHRDYNESISKAKTMNRKLAGDLKNLPLYSNNPRLLPQNVHPVCQEMNLVCTKTVHIQPPTSKKKTKMSEAQNTTAKKQTKRKKKGDENENESLTSIDSDIPTSQTKTNKYDIRYAMQKALEKNKASQSSPHNDSSGSLFQTVGCVDLVRGSKKVNKGKTKAKNNVNRQKNLINKIFNHKEIEIVELDNSRKINEILYDENLPGNKFTENIDSLVKFLSENDTKTIKRLLENNKLVHRSKANFSKLIDIEKISSYLCIDTEDVDLLNDLRRVRNYNLTSEDLNLTDQDIDEVIFINTKPSTTSISPNKLTPLNDYFVTKRRDYTTFKKEVRDDSEKTAVDNIPSPAMPDNSPFKGLNVLASSTPLKNDRDIENKIINEKLSAFTNSAPVKVDENIETEIVINESKNKSDSSVNKSSALDFQFWDDNFFTLEEKNNDKEKIDDFAPQLSKNISTQFYGEQSMITISQAINMVDAFQTQQVEKSTEKDNSALVKPVSPVLLSQKRKKAVTKKTEFSLFDSPKNNQEKENNGNYNVVQLKPLSPLLTCSQKRWKNSPEKTEPFSFHFSVESQNAGKSEKPVEKPVLEEYDSSPIFISTQRRKRTPVKETKFTLSGSPILSQKTKRKSKKSLKFDHLAKSEETSITKAEIKPVPEEKEEEDIFLEAEEEFEKLNENRLESSEEKKTNLDVLSQQTIVYNADAVEEDAIMDSKKIENNSGDKLFEIKQSNNSKDSEIDFHGSNKENFSIFDHLHKSDKPPPKTAIVRPFGFDNKDDSTDDSEWLVINPGKKATAINPRSKTSGNRNKRYDLSVSKTEQQKFSDKKVGERKKIFTPDFNFFSDDFFDVPDEKVENASDDSDDFFNPKKKNNKMKIIDDTLKSNIKDDDFDDDLSDGALEAIKAVEEFEKSEKSTKAVSCNETMPSSSRGTSNKNQKSDFVFWNSDDSGEFFQPMSTKNTKSNIAEQSKEHKLLGKGEATIDLSDENDYLINKSNRQNKSSKKKKKQQNVVSSFDFIELEAALSDENRASSDEENTSGLDEYDSSFVDEREVLTQAPNVDMTAKYLQSTKSPINKNSGFKIPKPKKPIDANIFSQMPETEVDYEHDSFCVDEIIEEHDDQEMSALELAELILESRKKKKKRKRQEELEVENKKTKHRRILRIESESSDDENIQKNVSKLGTENKLIINSRINSPKALVVEKIVHQATPNPTTNRASEKGPSKISKEVFNKTPKQDKTSKPPSNCSSEKSTSKLSSKQLKKQVIFISAKQLASTSEITTALRAKWNVQVIVRSFLKADFIISWKTGINRITLTDFSNGNVQLKSSLKDAIQELKAFFVNPVYIVEDDKNKGLPLTTGSHTTMWTKHTYDTLAKFFHANVKVVFSKNKDDTARIIALFTKGENDKGNGIVINGNDISPRTETKLKFYKSLPGLNIANALRICQKFRSITSFINCCDSSEIISAELNVDRTLAIKIFQALCNVRVT